MKSSASSTYTVSTRPYRKGADERAFVVPAPVGIASEISYAISELSPDDGVTIEPCGNITANLQRNNDAQHHIDFALVDGPSAMTG